MLLNHMFQSILQRYFYFNKFREVDEAIRGIWKYPNGLSDMVRTDQTQENPNYRLCKWWHTAVYGSMSGKRVKNSDGELYIASVDEEKGEAKILIGANSAQTIRLSLSHLPFQGEIHIDCYKITKSVDPEKDITQRINDLPVNENGIRDMNDRVHSFLTTSMDGAPMDFDLFYPAEDSVMEPRGTLRWQDTPGDSSMSWRLRWMRISMI